MPSSIPFVGAVLSCQPAAAWIGTEGRLGNSAAGLRCCMDEQGRQSQRTFSGSGADEDIVVASARAYVSGLNKLVAFMKAPKVT